MQIQYLKIYIIYIYIFKNIKKNIEYKKKFIYILY